MTCPTDEDFEKLTKAWRDKWARKFPHLCGTQELSPDLAFTFYESGVESRHLCENQDGSLYDQTADLYYATLEDWWSDVNRRGESEEHIPLSQLCFGSCTDPESALNSAEIEEVLGWTHNPLTAAEVAAAAPAAGAGASTIPTKEALYVEALCKVTAASNLTEMSAATDDSIRAMKAYYSQISASAEAMADIEAFQSSFIMGPFLGQLLRARTEKQRTEVAGKLRQIILAKLHDVFEAA
jgi:hypothetical protein